jgi:predicted transcriptional regulator
MNLKSFVDEQNSNCFSLITHIIMKERTSIKCEIVIIVYFAFKNVDHEVCNKLLELKIFERFNNNRIAYVVREN